MKLPNMYRIGALMLIIMLTLSVLVGCANEEASSIETSEIQEEWNVLINEEQTYVKKIEIGQYTAQPLASSTAVIVQNVEVTDIQNVILLLDILKKRDANFYDHADYIEDSVAYLNSKAGMEMMQICFFDSNNQEKIKLHVYADNTGEIYKVALNPSGKEAWRLCYIVEFTQPIFDSMQMYYEFVSMNQ